MVVCRALLEGAKDRSSGATRNFVIAKDRHKAVFAMRSVQLSVWSRSMRVSLEISGRKFSPMCSPSMRWRAPLSVWPQLRNFAGWAKWPMYLPRRAMLQLVQQQPQGLHIPKGT